MDSFEEDSPTSQGWIWLAVAVGAALGAVGVVYLFRHRDPAFRMDRLLRRCEDRIHNIESYLAQLESTLSS